MRTPSSPWFVAGLLLFVVPDIAVAGMPVVRLADVPRMRLQTISFFLMGFLVSAALIRFIWNGLRRDFTRLPHLSYAKALGVVGLWGLLFVLVLTMISGARELLTPGAWEKQGATYRLKNDAKDAPARSSESDDTLDMVRRQKLDELRVALWQYAESHDGAFPADRSTPAIPVEKWLLPQSVELRYYYVGGQAIKSAKAPLAYEPDMLRMGPRLVLFTTGDIESMTVEALAQALQVEKR